MLKLRIKCVFGITLLLLAHDLASAFDVRDAAGGAEVGMGLGTSMNGSFFAKQAEQDYQFLDEQMRYQLAKQHAWNITYTASATWRYDSNVRMAGTGAQADTTESIRPSVEFSYGTDQSTLQLNSNYSAEFNYFDKNPGENSVNQVFRLEGKVRTAKMTFSVSGNVSDVTGGNLDVGGQAERMQDSESIDANYAYSEKLSFGFSMSKSNADYKSLQRNSSITFGGYTDYQFTTALKLGIQFNEVSSVAQTIGSETAQQVLMRIDWNISPKVSIGGSFGAQILYPHDNAATISPNGSLRIKYEAGPKTNVSMGLSSSTQYSPSVSGQYMQTQEATVSMTQQVGDKLTLGVDLGASASAYESSFRNTAATRKDNVYFIRPWISYRLNRHVSFNASFTETTSQSSGAGSMPFSRQLSTIGISLTW